MNAVPSPSSLRWLILFSLACLALAAPLLSAAETNASSGLLIQANFMMEIVGNRARMIQVSLVCVVFGCALLWWRR